MKRRKEKNKGERNKKRRNSFIVAIHYWKLLQNKWDTTIFAFYALSYFIYELRTDDEQWSYYFLLLILLFQLNCSLLEYALYLIAFIYALLQTSLAKMKVQLLSPSSLIAKSTMESVIKLTEKSDIKASERRIEKKKGKDEDEDRDEAEPS